MANFKFGLNYNDPPANLSNRQVFDARNITLAKDGKSIVTDKGTVAVIPNIPVGVTILDIMTTDKEVIMFCSDNLIRRYNLDTKITKVCNVEIPLITPIKGVYSYNIKGELIIAITQYSDDGADRLPLKVINLDKPFKHDLLHDLNPYKPVANIKNSSILASGSSINKGSYDFFISYQLDDDNYTNWINIGNTIYVSDIVEEVITSEFHSADKTGAQNKVWNAVIKRPVNSKYSTVNKTIKLDLEISDYRSLYTKFRLAYINSYNNKVTSKIIGLYDITNLTILYNGDFIGDISIDELTVDSPNIYNVKAIANYNNRLYVGNYEEFNDDTENLQALADKVYPIWKTKLLGNSSTKYICNSSQYDKYVAGFTINTISEPLSPYNGKECSYDAITYFRDVMAEDYTESTTLIFNNYGTRCYNRDESGTVLDDKLEPIADHGSTYIAAKIKDLRVVIPRNKSEQAKLSYVMTDTTIGTGRLYVEYFIDCSSGTYSLYEDSSIKVNLINIYNTGVTYIPNATTRPSHDVLLNNRSLEPNEIYNFFIHYVRADGTYTRGYKINGYGRNDYSYIYDDDPSTPNGYFSVTETVKQASVANDFTKYKYANILRENITSTEEAYMFVNNAIIRNDTGQYADGYFGLFINSKNQNLYRAPDYSALNVQSISAYKHYVIDVNFENIDMPTTDNYVGVLFSYEKVESTVLSSGISTDENLDYIHWSNRGAYTYNKARCNASELILNPSLYTGNIINNYSQCYQVPVIYDTPAGTTNRREYKPFVMSYDDRYSYYNYNNFTNVTKTYIMPENDADLNKGRELCLRAQFVNGVNIRDINAYNLYQLLNVNKAIYTNDIKQLISLGYIKKLTVNSKGNVYKDDSIVLNLPSFNTVDSIYTYNKSGVYYVSGESLPRNFSNDKAYWEANDKIQFNEMGTPYCQVQFIKFSKFYIPAETLESTAIKKYYATFKYITGIAHAETTYGDTSRLQTILNPSDSSNAFKLDVSYILQASKLLSNIDPTKLTNYKYGKSIRRSNVLASESTKIGWRHFDANDYTIINEQKGDITNLVGIGYYLLCHCERSLFAFSKQSTINADNQAIQLGSVDTFDLPYQEIFTSDKGVCGLQNYFCNCIADGKYFWFDNKQASLYCWDSGSIKLLSNNVDSAFFYGGRVNNPYFNTIWTTSNNVLLGSMAYDNVNKRVLMNLPSTEDTDHSYSLIFEYSLIVEGLISYHIYPSHSKLFSSYNSVVIGNSSGSKEFRLVNTELYKPNVVVGESYVDIIFTDESSINKVLNYLSVKTDVTNDVKFVDKLLVYSDKTSTCLLDTQVDTNWNLGIDYWAKPHYDGGNFNYNVLFNAVANNFTNPTVGRLDSNDDHTNIKPLVRYSGEPINGKWFVVRLIMSPNKYYMINNVELDISKY